MSKIGTILQADNDERFLRERKEQLERAGYLVLPASSPDEVRRIVEHGIVHLIVTDLRLSNDNDERDISGLLLARELDPDIPKIIMTRYADYEAVREALSPAVDGLPVAINFLAKQEGGEALLQAIARAFQEHVGINFSLGVEFAEGLTINKLVESFLKSQFVDKPSLSNEELGDELDDLLRKLFSKDSKIIIHQDPDSSEELPLIRVLRTTQEGRQQEAFVRISERYKGQQEWESVRPSVSIKQLWHVKTQRFSGICYVQRPEALKTILWGSVKIGWDNVAQAIQTGDRELLEQSSDALTESLSKRLGCKLLQPPRAALGYRISNIDTSIIFTNSLLSDDLLLIFHHELTIEWAHLKDLRKLVIKFADRRMCVALLFFFGSADSIDASKKLIQSKLFRTYACDLLIINLDSLREIMLAAEPAKALRDFVLSQVNLRAVSPFNVTGVTPDYAFFGRESELRKITEHARTTSYAVISGRRFGKSSLLDRLHRSRLPVAGFRTVLHDCASHSTSDSFLRAEISNWQPGPPAGAPFTFSQLLDSPPNDKPLVLLLDETDKLIPAERSSGWPIFNALRTLSNAKRMQVVLSGESTMREAMGDASSPLFNLANPILLGPLDSYAVEELITAPMKELYIRLTDEPAIVRRIYDFTSGHPNIIQRLCSRLIDQLNKSGTRSIALDDINLVIDDPAFQEGDFLQTYWDQATLLERIITLLMAQTAIGRHFSFLHRLGIRLNRSAKAYQLDRIRNLLRKRAQIVPTVAQTREALDRLTNLRFILKHSSVGYQFAVESFPRVLSRTRIIEDLLDSLVENYEKSERLR
ncbi:MAG: AAA family ATPase [Blastocatellia bacterium]